MNASVPVLMYHQVGRFSPLPWKTHGGIFCETRRFKAQMAFLKRAGFTVVPLRDAVNGLCHGAPLPPKPVALTFDDGYQSFYDNALPVLKHYGYPATVYVLSQALGGKAQWLKDKYEKVPLMGGERLRELGRDGVTVGSHGRTHRRLAELSLEGQKAEIAESKKELEDLLGQEVTDFCYPYGSYGADTVRLVQEAGYASAVSCRKRKATSADSAFEIPRIPINYGNTVVGFLWKLYTMPR